MEGWIQMSKGIRNQKGFTLAEVMVSFVILELAALLLISGTAVARQMEKRAEEISVAGDLLEERINEEAVCVSGTLQMDIGGEKLCGSGWLYRYEEGDSSGFQIEAVRFESSVSRYETLEEDWIVTEK